MNPNVNREKDDWTQSRVTAGYFQRYAFNSSSVPNRLFLLPTMKSFASSVVIVAAALIPVASAFTQTAAPAAKTVLLAAEDDVMPPRMWDSMVDKTQRSAALPWLPRPIACDGTLAGDQGFDPFYLSSIPKNFAGFIQPPQWEETDGIETIYWMREAELKHGRVAMLAVTGWVAADNGFRFPFSQYSIDSIPDSYHAHDILVGQGTMGVLLLLVGLIEFASGAALVQVSKGELERDAGDFQLTGGLLNNKSAEQILDMKTKEINHCRLAMLAFGGIATQTALENGVTSFPYY